MKISKNSKNQKLSVWIRIRRNWGLYLLLLPAVVLLICFTYRPMYGVLIAFKEYKAVDGIFGSEWATPWFKYFKKYFDSYQFSATIKNTLSITLYSLAVFPIPIILALGINQMRNGRYKKNIPNCYLYASLYLYCGYGRFDYTFTITWKWRVWCNM